MANAHTGLAAFNASFEHRTGYEWLSRDAAEVDAYVADPWCGWDVPPDVIPSLFAPAPQLADPAQLARIRSDLPILIASGDADPLAADGVLLEQLGQRYRDAGVADVTVKLYPAARHEILNESNRDEVTGGLWRCCGSALRCRRPMTAERSKQPYKCSKYPRIHVRDIANSFSLCERSDFCRQLRPSGNFSQGPSICSIPTDDCASAHRYFAQSQPALVWLALQSTLLELSSRRCLPTGPSDTC